MNHIETDKSPLLSSNVVLDPLDEIRIFLNVLQDLKRSYIQWVRMHSDTCLTYGMTTVALLFLKQITRITI